MNYKCEHQYEDREMIIFYDRCLLTKGICVFSKHNTQHACQNFKLDEVSKLESKANEPLFVGSKL